MEQSVFLFLLTAAGVGVIHTLMGPDHYLPFAALSRARSWSLRRTLSVTAICGGAHVLSALILGIFAASAGQAVARLEAVESVRGSLAAWLLTAFGFVYAVWGLRRAFTERAAPPEGNGTPVGERKSVGWALFIIFALGPCEPFIPLVMASSVRGGAGSVVATALVFGLATVATMLTAVTVLAFGDRLPALRRVRGGTFFYRFGNALAGSLICCCGLGMTFLGL